MINSIVKLILFSLLLCAPRAWSAAVLFEGLEPSHHRLIKEKIPEFNAANASLETVDEVLRVLMLTGEFERVLAESIDAGIKITGTPLRLIEEVQISGNHIASDSDLKEIIQLETGEKFDRRRVLKAGENLKAFYGERGYFNAVIEVTFLKAKKSMLTIQFDILEKEPCEVVEIGFVSANSALNERLYSSAKRYLEKPLTTELVDGIRRRAQDLFVSKQYMKASLSDPEILYDQNKTTAKIQFKVNEPFAYQVFFEGHKHLSRSALYKLVHRSDYKLGQFEPKSELSSQIRNHYLSLGFPSVSVTPVENEVSRAFIRRITFKINEGPRVKIKNYEVSGRISRPPVYYSNFIKNHSTSLIKKGYYNRENLELAYRNLITELRNQGFLKAKIQAARLEYLNSNDEAKIVLTIDEGPLTQISRIEFIGAKDFQESILLTELNIQNNSPLSLKDLEESIKILKDFYLTRGYLEMKILNENEDLVEYNDRGTQAVIKFRIYEGPKVIVRTITLEGNTFTKSQVILNEIDFSDGDILTPDKIDESILRLNRLGIFSRVSIRMVEEGTSVSERNILISISERDPGLIRFGAGVNSERGLTARGFTSMTYSNLFGTARSIYGRVELQSNISDINYLEHRVSVGYLEPFLFGTRTRGRINLTRSDEVFDTFNSNEGRVVPIVTSDKIDMLIERDLTRHNKLIWTLWSLDNLVASERNGRCNVPNLNFECNSQQIAMIGPSLDLDYRDNPFIPTTGTFSRLSLDYSHPSLGSSESIEFLKLEGVFNYYLPLGSPKWVWANSLGGGYVSNLSDKRGSGVPVKHAFILGGSSTLRGFESNNLVERVPDNKEFPIASRGPTALVIPQDSHYFLFKSELRWTIVGDHGAVLFYDGGLVQVSGYRFDDPYRDSVGVGYRYNTPVGPLRIDVGYKLDRERLEKSIRGHIAIGTF